MAYWGLALLTGPNYNKKWAAFDKKVWSLSGYHECLLRLGRKVEAIMIEKQPKTATAVADVPVKSSCFCKIGDPKQCSRGI